MSELFVSVSLSPQNIQQLLNEAEYKKADRGECYSPLLKIVEGNSIWDTCKIFQALILPLTLIYRCSSVWVYSALPWVISCKTYPLKYGYRSNYQVQLRCKCQLLASLLATRRKRPAIMLKTRSNRSLGECVRSQVAQARNMSIGEHRHCCVTSKI